MRLLALFILWVPIQESVFQKILERLQAENLGDRDAAERELTDWIDDDAKATSVKAQLDRVDAEVKVRLERALAAVPVTKALRRLEKGDATAVDDLYALGDDAISRVQALAKEKGLYKDVLSRLEWLWVRDEPHLRVAIRIPKREIVLGEKVAIEIKLVNEAPRNTIIGNMMRHCHRQFSPSATLVNKEKHEIKVEVSSKPLPSEDSGTCDVTLKSGTTAVLKGLVWAVHREDKELPVGEYILVLDIDDPADPAATKGLPLKVVAKK